MYNWYIELESEKNPGPVRAEVQANTFAEAEELLMTNLSADHHKKSLGECKIINAKSEKLKSYVKLISHPFVPNDLTWAKNMI